MGVNTERSEYNFQVRMINKSEQESNKKVQGKCILCFPQDEFDRQICYILKELVIGMNEVLIQAAKPQNPQLKLNSFSQLIKSVFSQIQSITPATLQCDHERLKKMFCQGIPCSDSDLLRVSQTIFARITKRKYELEVIRNMLKNIPNSIDKMLKSSENFENSEQKKQQSEQKNQESEQLNNLQNSSSRFEQENPHDSAQVNAQQGMIEVPNQNHVQNLTQNNASNNSNNLLQINQQQMFQFQSSPYGYYNFPPGYPYPYYFNPNQRF